MRIGRISLDMRRPEDSTTHIRHVNRFVQGLVEFLMDLPRCIWCERHSIPEIVRCQPTGKYKNALLPRCQGSAIPSMRPLIGSNLHRNPPELRNRLACLPVLSRVEAALDRHLDDRN